MIITASGTAPGQTDKAFAEAKRFFDLPLAVKREIAIEKSPCHRGYFAMGSETRLGAGGQHLLDMIAATFDYRQDGAGAS